MNHSITSPPQTGCPAVEIPDDVVPRLLAFFKTQDEDAALASVSEIWRPILTEYQAPLRAVFKTGNEEAIRAYLSNLYGDHGNSVVGIDVPNDAASCFSDDLVRAATAVGVIPAYAPYQPNEKVYGAETLLYDMEGCLQTVISYPGGGSMRGAVVGDRFIPHKLIEAVPIVESIFRLQLMPITILEVGAGTGMLAYLFTRAFSRCKYHIVDLPLVSVMQAFLLMCALGSKMVWLNGEEPNPHSSIHIHGLNRPRLTCDLVINKDSLPEFPNNVALDYLGYIEKSLRTDGYFLSINHESHLGGQTRVFELVRGLRLIHRAPWWMRDGYVEEFWQKP